jgi:hypothetical protein
MVKSQPQNQDTEGTFGVVMQGTFRGNERRKRQHPHPTPQTEARKV